MIASKDYVLSKLQELTTYAKKNFGQNFLIDSNVTKKIVDALEINETDKVIEIGPGLGALSEQLSLYNNEISLYDIDEDMVKHLMKVFKNNKNISVIKSDFLKVSLDSLKGNFKLIGNLPYYITTALIEKALLSKCNVSRCVFMIQKEVYQRLIAKVNTKEYSPLSILISYCGKISKVLEVSRNCFYPAPHVDSLVFKIDFNKDINKEEINKLYKLMNTLFLTRRKTISNNLTRVVKKEEIAPLLERCKINPLARPENLSVEDYLNLLHNIK